MGGAVYPEGIQLVFWFSQNETVAFVIAALCRCR